MRAGNPRRRRYTSGLAAGLAAVSLWLAAGYVLGHHAAAPATAAGDSAPAREEDAGAASGGGRCGRERWDVKTGADPAARVVDLDSPKPVTIGSLSSLRPPFDPTTRVAPVETTVYVIRATMTGFKQETDSDYHVVIGDGLQTMIVEIPSPGCVAASSPFRSMIASARAEFDARYRPGPEFESASVPVIVTGVGFFDRSHGQVGVAPNGIELHPVLDIAFR